MEKNILTSQEKEFIISVLSQLKWDWSQLELGNLCKQIIEKLYEEKKEK